MRLMTVEFLLRNRIRHYVMDKLENKLSAFQSNSILIRECGKMVLSPYKNFRGILTPASGEVYLAQLGGRIRLVSHIGCPPDAY